MVAAGLLPLTVVQVLFPADAEDSEFELDPEYFDLGVVSVQDEVEDEIADVMVVAELHAVVDVKEGMVVAVGEDSFVDDEAAVDNVAAALNVVHVAAAQFVGELGTPIEHDVAVRIPMKLVAMFEKVVFVVVEDMACVVLEEAMVAVLGMGPTVVVAVVLCWGMVVLRL